MRQGSRSLPVTKGAELKRHVRGSHRGIHRKARSDPGDFLQGLAVITPRPPNLYPSGADQGPVGLLTPLFDAKRREGKADGRVVAAR